MLKNKKKVSRMERKSRKGEREKLGIPGHAGP